MNKFKVGDRVKCISNKLDSAVKYGEIVTVTSIDGKYIGFEAKRPLSSFYTPGVQNGTIANWAENCFELVTEEKVNKNNLSPGTKCRRTADTGSGAYAKGVVFTIHRQEGEYYRCVEHNVTHHPDFFEVIAVPNNFDELIKTANAGLDALRELFNNNRDAFELVYHGSKKPYTNVASAEYMVQLKKKSFEPFTTSNGWLVKQDGEDLHIGCKKFSAADFKRMLTSLLHENKNNDGTDFFATKNGIKYKEHNLSWKDAELILQKLNEMEK